MKTAQCCVFLKFSGMIVWLLMVGSPEHFQANYLLDCAKKKKKSHHCTELTLVLIYFFTN